MAADGVLHEQIAVLLEEHLHPVVRGQQRLAVRRAEAGIRRRGIHRILLACRKFGVLRRLREAVGVRPAPRGIRNRRRIRQVLACHRDRPREAIHAELRHCRLHHARHRRLDPLAVVRQSEECHAAAGHFHLCRITEGQVCQLPSIRFMREIRAVAVRVVDDEAPVRQHRQLRHVRVTLPHRAPVAHGDFPIRLCG